MANKNSTWKIFAIIILFIVFINPASSQTADEWFDIGNTFFYSGEFKKAIEAYDRAIAIKPKFKEAWLYKGHVFYNRYEYRKAVEAYDMAIAIDPRFEDAWLNKGVALADAGEYDKAIEAFDRVITIYPNAKEGWFGKGIVLNDLGRYAEALQLFDKVTAIAPNFADAWAHKGNALFYSGEYKKAIEAYNKAIAIDPNFEQARINRELAINKMAEQATTPASSQSAEAWYNKGISFGFLGEYKKAIEAYDKAIAIDPYFKEAWYNKGVIFGYLGEYKKEIEAYDRAIAIDPDYKKAWSNKGVAFGYLGEYKKAVEAFDRAIAIDPYFEPAKKNREYAIKKMAEQATAAPPSSNQENSWVLVGGIALIILICIIALTNKNKTANDVTQPEKAISTQNAIPANFEERVQGGIVEHKQSVDVIPESDMINQLIELLKLSLEEWSGRFSRRQYAIIFFSMVGFNVLVGVSAGFVGLMESDIGLLGFLMWFIVASAIAVGSAVRRFHDLDLSGWYVLLLIIPFVNFATFLYMILKPGKEAGETRWG